MIYTDGLRITADSREEIVKFANKVGIGKAWYYPEQIPYYVVVCPHKMDHVIEKGVKPLSKENMNRFLKGLKLIKNEKKKG